MPSSPSSTAWPQAGVHAKKEPEEKEEPEEAGEGVRKGAKGKRSHVWRSECFFSSSTVWIPHFRFPTQALHLILARHFTEEEGSREAAVCNSCSAEVRNSFNQGHM